MAKGKYMVKISVIIPAYNVEKYIKKCLESIVSQDYNSYEIIVIDDGSKDNTAVISENFLQKYDIPYIVHSQKNMGQSTARNTGIKLARGEYIVFVDSDDWVDETFLSKLYKTITNFEVDFAFCDFGFVGKKTKKLDNETEIFNQEDIIKKFLDRNVIIIIPAMIFKKEFLLINEIELNEKTRFSEDLLFIWNMIFASKKVAHIKEILYNYNLRNNSIMTSSDKERIINGYFIFSESLNDYANKYKISKKYVNMIIPRWVLGTMYSSAKIHGYNNFMYIYLRIAKNIDFRYLESMRDLKVKFSSILLKKYPFIFYCFARIF